MGNLLKGILTVFVGGAIAGGATAITDPTQLQDNPGAAAIGAAVGGIIGLVNWLRRSPRNPTPSPDRGKSRPID